MARMVVESAHMYAHGKATISPEQEPMSTIELQQFGLQRADAISETMGSATSVDTRALEANPKAVLGREVSIITSTGEVLPPTVVGPQEVLRLLYDTDTYNTGLMMLLPTVFETDGQGKGSHRILGGRTLVDFVQPDGREALTSIVRNEGGHSTEALVALLSSQLSNEMADYTQTDVHTVYKRVVELTLAQQPEATKKFSAFELSQEVTKNMRDYMRLVEFVAQQRAAEIFVDKNGEYVATTESIVDILRVSAADLMADRRLEQAFGSLPGSASKVKTMV